MSALSDMYNSVVDGSKDAIQKVTEKIQPLNNISPTLVTTDMKDEIAHEAELQAVPQPEVALDEDPTKADGNSVVAKVVTGIGVTVATGLVVALLSGVLQRFARKKAAESLRGGVWAIIATIPSLANPLNPFLKYPAYSNLDEFEESRASDEISAVDFYKAIARVGHVKAVQQFDLDGAYLLTIKQTGEVEPIDDFGGFLEFKVVIGEDNYYLCGFVGDSLTGIFYREGDTDMYLIEPATFGQVRAGRLEV